MNRFGAFAVHLGISLIIFVILGYVILYHWYPDFFFASDGGWQGIRIVALVDLVLGPVLTLIVYKKGKPSLRFDLTCIGVFQAVCLIAGMWVVYSERPIAIVFSDGIFRSMTQDDYREADQPVPDFSGFPGSPPYWIHVHLPDDPEQQLSIRRDSMDASVPLSTLSEYYEPFDFNQIDPERDGLSEDYLRGKDMEGPFLDAFLTTHGGTLNDYVFLPFGTRYTLAAIAYHPSDGKFDYVAIPGGLASSSDGDEGQ